MGRRRPNGMRLLPSTPSARTVRVGAALGAVAAVALAGCGVAHPATQKTADQKPGTTGKVTPAKRPAIGPQQRAEADAGTILTAFAVPLGAHRLAAAPTAGAGALKTAIQIPGTPDLVDKTSWWLAPGKPQQVLAWEAKHVSHRYSSEGTATISDGGHASIWSDMFSLPAVNGVLDSRELIVEVVQDGKQTAIRVDAQVTWQPVTPASDRIPAAAKAVTISLNLGLNERGKKAPKPVTITDPAKVSQLRALINAQKLFPPGNYDCPADFGNSLTLTFRARAGGPAIAVAANQLSGCGMLTITLGGKAQPALSGVSGTQVLKIAGLSWKLPAL